MESLKLTQHKDIKIKIKFYNMFNKIWKVKLNMDILSKRKKVQLNLLFRH